MSKSSGRPPLEGSANNLPAHVGTCPILGVGQEVQKEEVMPAASVSRSDDQVAERGPLDKVSDSSSLIGPKNVHFSSLKSDPPMCGPTPMPRVRSKLNPAAEKFELPPGWFDQGLACWQFSLQQMTRSLLARPQQVG